MSVSSSARPHTSAHSDSTNYTRCIKIIIVSWGGAIEEVEGDVEMGTV